MKQYRDRVTGNIVSLDKVKKRYPNISFPTGKWDKLFCNQVKFDPVVIEPKPENTDPLKIVKSAGLEKNHLGEYVQKWQIADLFSMEYVDENGDLVTIQMQEEKYLSSLNDSIAKSNRNTRDTLLAETDWWAKTDVTLTSERRAYRQALRDITTHENWPNLEDADWPTKPE
jgi:hypothetical protein